MNRRGLWAAGVLILAALAATVFFLSRNRTETAPAQLEETQAPAEQGPEPSGDETESQAVTVEYTDSGYAPANLTIKKGVTVKFVNGSSRDMWVASDPHPVHTDHPVFDAEKSYSSDQTYSFTFTEAGEYGYHNHDFSAHTGTITVTD